MKTYLYALVIIAFSFGVEFCAFAAESCEEYCPTQEEGGVSSFTTTIGGSTLECCCLQESDGQPYTSREMIACYSEG
jgi:hypothetical protein